MKNKMLLSVFWNLRKTVSGLGLSRLPFVKGLSDSTYDFLKPKGIRLVDLGDFKMFVDGQDGVHGLGPKLLIDNHYEDYETRLFSSLIKPGMTVVDIGANIGYYTLLFSKLVGPTGRVYAFEPEPNNYELLKRNIDKNEVKNVFTINKAVSNENETLEFFVDNVNFGGSSFSKENVSPTEKPIEKIEVKAVTLDYYFPEIKVDFIKVDTQGAEELVFLGAEKLIKRSCLTVATEFGVEGLRNMGSDPYEFFRLLVDSGFTVNYIGGDCLRPVGYQEIMGIVRANGGDSWTVNILLEKEGKK